MANRDNNNNNNTPPHQPATPLPTPTHGAGGLGSFSVASGAHIAASPDACIGVILDAASYPQWNRFCRACIVEDQGPTGPPPPGGRPPISADGLGPKGGSSSRLGLGTKFVFDVHMDLDEELGNAKESSGVKEEGKGGGGGEPSQHQHQQGNEPSSGGVGAVPDEAGITSPRITGRSTALEVSVLEPIGKRDGGEGGEGGRGGGGGGGDDGSDGGVVVVGDRRTKEKRGWRVAWRTRGVTGMALRSERVQEFVQDDEGKGTVYTCWETFYGFLAPAVRIAVGGKLERGFGAWTEDLKHRAETLEARVE